MNRARIEELAGAIAIARTQTNANRLGGFWGKWLVPLITPRNFTGVST